LSAVSQVWRTVRAQRASPVAQASVQESAQAATPAPSSQTCMESAQSVRVQRQHV